MKRRNETSIIILLLFYLKFSFYLYRKWQTKSGKHNRRNKKELTIDIEMSGRTCVSKLVVEIENNCIILRNRQVFEYERNVITIHSLCVEFLVLVKSLSSSNDYEEKIMQKHRGKIHIYRMIRTVQCGLWISYSYEIHKYTTTRLFLIMAHSRNNIRFGLAVSIVTCIYTHRHSAE